MYLYFNVSSKNTLEEYDENEWNLEYFLESELLVLLEAFSAPLTYLPWGLRLPHLILGVAACGFGGFFFSSFGFIPFFIGGNNRTRVGGIVFVVLIGIVRMFMYTYSLFKRLSGDLLENAENIILEVGEPYDEEDDFKLEQRDGNNKRGDENDDDTKINETKSTQREDSDFEDDDSSGGDDDDDGDSQ